MSGRERAIPAGRSALVVGGGLAGMQASLLLAATGVHVYLVDRAPAIGGHQPLLDKTFPTDSCGLCFMSPRPAAYCPFVECERSDDVTVLASTEVLGMDGRPGDFSVRTVRHARGVDADRCNSCGKCAEVCPVTTASEFGGGIESRKAIYKPFVQAVPDAYLIDWEKCTRCGECASVCSKDAIDLEERDSEETLKVGAVVLAPGFKAVDGGLRTEYGYGVFPNVVTSIQVERMLSYGGPTGGRAVRPSDGVAPERIAFIQCVGSRDPSNGKNYCSSVCCMYAAKQATLLTERAPESAVTVFQMDLRGVGKGYEEYLARVQSLSGVEYRRSAVATVKQVPGSKDLLVKFVGPDGAQREERFGLVVLSVGVEPSDGVRDLAARMGVPTDAYGFIESDPLFHEKTLVEGVFVAGGAREPMDVADAVAEGAAAAASVARLLGVRLGEAESAGDVDGEQEETDLEGEAPAEPSGPEADTARREARPPSAGPRVGVLLCDCAGEVGGVVDLAGLAAQIAGLPNVAGIEVVDGLCGPGAADTLRAVVDRLGVDRLVVGACALRRIEGTVRLAASAAGLDRSLVEFANLREQVAWVHPAGGEAVAAKAEALIAMAVTRAAHLEPWVERPTALAPTALVVGGGVAGITAASELASHGIEVWLAEREPELRWSAGGLPVPGERSTGPLATNLVPGAWMPDRVRHDVGAGADGSIGADLSAVHVMAGAEVLKIEGRVGAFRSTIRNGDGEEEIEHSVVVLATGVAEATSSGYLLGEHPAVMSQSQMAARLAADVGWAGGVKSVAMILCAGNEGGGYCSRTCCVEAVESALAIKRQNPNAGVYVLHREMRTYGFQEERYEAARRAGVVFLRREAGEAPEVEPNGEKVRIRILEPRLGTQVVLDVDAVGVATGVAPRPVNGLVTSLGIGVDQHGIPREANRKTRSTETERRGVFLAGACQAPRSLEDTLIHAKGAAMRALALLREGKVVAPETMPVVNERICSGCGLCVEACCFGARVLDDERRVSKVVDALCQGCGSCAVACPNGATQQGGFTRKAMVEMLDVAVD